MSVTWGRLVSIKFTCLLPQLLFTYEGNSCRAMQVVQATISVHGPTVLSWHGVVTTSIVGLIRAGPAVEARRTQGLIWNKIHHCNTRLVKSIWSEVHFWTGHEDPERHNSPLLQTRHLIRIGYKPHVPVGIAPRKKISPTVWEVAWAPEAL